MKANPATDAKILAVGRGYLAHVYKLLASTIQKCAAACFVGGALTAILDGEGKSFSVAALGKRILTVQEVRAIRNADFEAKSVIEVD